MDKPTLPIKSKGHSSSCQKTKSFGLSRHRHLQKFASKRPPVSRGRFTKRCCRPSTTPNLLAFVWVQIVVFAHLVFSVLKEHPAEAIEPFQGATKLTVSAPVIDRHTTGFAQLRHGLWPLLHGTHDPSSHELAERSAAASPEPWTRDFHWLILFQSSPSSERGVISLTERFQKEASPTFHSKPQAPCGGC